MQSGLLRIVQIFRTSELLHFKMQNKTNHSLCVATRHIKEGISGMGVGGTQHPGCLLIPLYLLD